MLKPYRTTAKLSFACLFIIYIGSLLETVIHETVKIMRKLIQSRLFLQFKVTIAANCKDVCLQNTYMVQFLKVPVNSN